MNLPDSRLEEIKKRCFLQDGDLFREDAAELFVHITEQDREIERLQKENEIELRETHLFRKTATKNGIRAEEAEAELAEMKQYNEVLKSQRADVYKEGVEDMLDMVLLSVDARVPESEGKDALFEEYRNCANNLLEHKEGMEDGKREAGGEVKRLQGLERIAQQFVGEWNEFEHPIALEWDMPDPMRTIHGWACDWYSHAEKAEAERDGYKNQIKAADSIIKIYEIDGPLLHDRVFKLIQHFEFEIEKFKEVLKWYAEKAHAITRFWIAKPPQTDAAMAVMTELSLDDGQRAHRLIEEKP